MKILITGVAGFIGFSVTKRCLEEGFEIVGIDNLSNYYDVNLKIARLNELEKFNKGDHKPFTFELLDIENCERVDALFAKEKFDLVCNFAGQVGVRYSIEHPQAYISTNIQGFFNILDATAKSNIKRFIYASSSSVYGANKDIPYRESDKSERPVSLYAATKKANELFAYSYSSIYKLTTIGLRFFTVYGPWGRPDMSPYLFTSAIKEGREIKVFNHGEMLRDFTYIDDIVDAVFTIINGSNDSVSEVYNVGNASPIRLNDFITTLERNIGKHAIRHNMPMQSGDVLATWADTAKLKRDYDYQPETSLNDGIKKYLAWYNEYYTK